MIEEATAEAAASIMKTPVATLLWAEQVEAEELSSTDVPTAKKL